MVTDNQVRILMELINREKSLKAAAAKAGMSEKTARKYRNLDQLPSQCGVPPEIRSMSYERFPEHMIGVLRI